MQNAKCGMQSEKCGVRNAECGMVVENLAVFFKMI